MPTYDYRCKACGHEMAVFQSMSAERLKHCPKCGADQLRRLIGTGAGIIFKGSGFYETDYKRARVSSSDSSEKKDEKKEKEPDTKSSETEKKDSRKSDD